MSASGTEPEVEADPEADEDGEDEEEGSERRVMVEFWGEVVVLPRSISGTREGDFS